MNEIGLQDWEMVPLLTFACDKKTIFEFEKQWLGLIDADLNMRSPITDRKEYKAEYHLNNRDAILKRQAEYRMANRDILLKRIKSTREIMSVLRGSKTKKKILCVLMLCNSSLVRC